MLRLDTPPPQRPTTATFLLNVTYMQEVNTAIKGHKFMAPEVQ